MKAFHRGGWKDKGDRWKLPEDVEKRNVGRVELVVGEAQRSQRV